MASSRVAGRPRCGSAHGGIYEGRPTDTFRGSRSEVINLLVWVL